MHSASQRLQAVFGLFTTVLSLLSILIGCTSYLHSPLSSPPSSYLPSVVGRGLVSLPEVVATANIEKVVVKKSRQPRSYNQRQQEYAHTSLLLDVDLRAAWHWNVKQLFVYLVLEYPGLDTSSASAKAALSVDEKKTIADLPLSSKPHGVFATNEVVVWDRIVQSRRESKFKTGKLRNKYALGDIAGVFAGRNATMSLHWNIQPHVGALQWFSDAMGFGKGGKTGVVIPFPERTK